MHVKQHSKFHVHQSSFKIFCSKIFLQLKNAKYLFVADIFYLELQFPIHEERDAYF